MAKLTAGATIYTTTGSGIGSPAPIILKQIWRSLLTGTLVEEPPHPAIVGQNVGFSKGGGAFLDTSTGIMLAQQLDTCMLEFIAGHSVYCQRPNRKAWYGGFTMVSPQ